MRLARIALPLRSCMLARTTQVANLPVRGSMLVPASLRSIRRVGASIESIGIGPGTGCPGRGGSDRCVSSIELIRGPGRRRIQPLWSGGRELSLCAVTLRSHRGRSPCADPIGQHAGRPVRAADVVQPRVRNRMIMRSTPRRSARQETASAPGTLRTRSAATTGPDTPAPTSIPAWRRRLPARTASGTTSTPSAGPRTSTR